MPKIVVLGGVVMDLVFRVAQLPEWRQAVQAYEFQMLPGGKGLNQAVAASQLGAEEVSIISAVGNDEFGQLILKALDEHQISRDFVLEVEGAATAVTNVFVNYQCEAAFVGWKSVTRNKVEQTLIKRAQDRIGSADAILITLEVSREAVNAAVQIAKKHDTLVLLNPAPPLDLPERLGSILMQGIHVVVPNSWEAAQLLGPGASGATPMELARRLHEMGPKIACVTTSEYGCIVATDGGVTEYPAFPSDPVDTTGGSDAFCAALAIGLANKQPLEEALLRANAAGAIAVSKFGGYPSMPSAAEVESFLRTRKPRTDTQIVVAADKK